MLLYQAKEFYGSGFIVGKNDNKTYILTNKHVVGTNKKVSVKWSDGSINKGVVIESAPNSDAWKKGIFLMISH